MPLDDRWTCQVTVAEGSSSTEHRVIVHRADLDRLAPGSPEPEPLIRATVDLMLQNGIQQAMATHLRFWRAAGICS